MYRINTILHGKCFVRYLRTRFCITNLTRSLRSLVRFLIRQQLVRKYRTPALPSHEVFYKILGTKKMTTTRIYIYIKIIFIVWRKKQSRIRRGKTEAVPLLMRPAQTARQQRGGEKGGNKIENITEGIMRPTDKATADSRSVQSFTIIKNTGQGNFVIGRFHTRARNGSSVWDYPVYSRPLPHRHLFSGFFWGRGRLYTGSLERIIPSSKVRWIVHSKFHFHSIPFSNYHVLPIWRESSNGQPVSHE